MAAATSHGHRQKQFLPPSPPPSPPAVRRRNKKHRDDDGFAKLAATPLPSPTLSATFDKEDKPEPLLTRIILTPVLFTSFLFSLFLVNAQDRARRAAAHAPHSSYLTYLFPSSWLDPEPYQDQHHSTWGRRGAAGHVGPNDAIDPRPGQLDGTRGDEGARIGKERTRKKSWHLNKKIRKMARLEVSDAFESQGKVIAVMVVMVVFSIIGVWVGMRWVWKSIIG